MTKLSKRAQSALLAAQGRQGAKVGWSSPAALDELQNAGFCTRDHNITRKGVIERDRISRQREDEAFG